jgi:Tfp pilus assembly protein PilX
MKRGFVLGVALVVLLLLAMVGATAQALRGERPILLSG